MAQRAATDPRQTYLVENYHPGLGADELRRMISRAVTTLPSRIAVTVRRQAE